MPVSTPNKSYNNRKDQVERCRDTVEGSDAVKHKGTKYLPKLSAMSNADYNAYRTRALFFSVAARSLAALVGTVTAREPMVENGEDSEAYIKDMSMTSTSVQELISSMATENLTAGRLGLLVDVSPHGGRAYVSTYTTESILSWRMSDDGLWLLSVVLKETKTVPDELDQFIMTEEDRYRHLYIDADGYYAVDIYDEDDNKVGDTVQPVARGSRLKFIPFISTTPEGIDIEPVKPPILDIVDVNLSQYITSADLEHGRHFTALPTPVVTGADTDQKLKVGSLTAWVIPNDKAKAYYLEFQGAGLASLENAIKEKTAQMAQFSSRLMDTSTRGSEASDTVKIRHASDAATLISLATTIESSINIVFGWLAEFDNLDPIKITLDKNFLESRLSASELKDLAQTYLDGGIDLPMYMYLLRRGEALPVDQESLDVSNDEKDKNSSGDDNTDENAE